MIRKTLRSLAQALEDIRFIAKHLNEGHRLIIMQNATIYQITTVDRKPSLDDDLHIEVVESN